MPKLQTSWLDVVRSNPELKKLLIPRINKYIPHQPFPKQTAFLLLNCLDAFYGGAAGGGKSDCLLMAALQYADVPGYAALLLRNSFKNLNMEGALINRAEEWLSGTDAHWNDKRSSWEFPSGATLSFGYLDGPRDHLNYKSAEFQFIGLDEASDLRWKQIRYMFSRLRRPKKIEYPDLARVPLRFRLASNPGGISHAEIKTNYIDVKTREDRIFIPSSLRDNPYLDYDEYKRSLMELDPVTREQLLEGDWDIREEGRMINSAWFKLADAAPIEGEVVRYWDMAATEPHPGNKEPAYTAGVKMLKTSDGRYFILSIARTRKSPRQIEALIRQTADIDTISVPISMEQEPGSSGVNVVDHYRRNILPEFLFKPDKVSGNKAQRAAAFASQAEAGNVYLVKAHWNSDFLTEAELFPDGTFKDQVDAASGAFNFLAGGKTETRVRDL